MRTLDKIKNIKIKYKIFILYIFDIFLILLSSILSEFIFLGYFPNIAKSLILNTFFFIIFYSIFSYQFNIYKYLNRYLGLFFIKKIFIVIMLSAILLYLSKYFVDLRYQNLNFIILNSLIFFCFLIFFRIFINFIYFSDFKFFKMDFNKKAFIFGAGTTGVDFYRNFKKNFKYNFLGFIDEDPSKISRYIDNLKIISFSDFLKTYKANNIKYLFICAPSSTSFKIQEIKKNLSGSSIKIIEPINKETNDFKIPLELNNNPKLYIHRNIKNFYKGKSILVTGAAGSIGQEICFQLNKLGANIIYCVDNNEYNLSVLTRRANSLGIKNFKYILLDVANKNLLFNIKVKIDIIFHAAAYKHVDIVQDNKHFGIYNNVSSTLNILEFCLKKSIRHFVFVSTDKAVKPTNIMGFTKRFGEILTCYYSLLNKANNFCSVRFGNVIGSSGSLLEILKKQISLGGPLTLTSKKATRYFMTISDAVSLVLKSLTLRRNGEILVLNMGEPIKIYNLMQNILKANNLTEKSKENKSGDIEIKIIGLRPGEKEHEELFYGSKNNIYNNKIYVENKILINKKYVKNLINKFKASIKTNSHFKTNKFLIGLIKKFNDISKK